MLDHVFYYRVGRRPAAIVSHPYHVDERAVAELRQRYLLNVVVDDYPSWRNPGWTRTLVITPDEERIAELGAEAERLRALHGKGSIQKWRDHLQGRKPLYLRGRAGWPFPAPGFGSKGVPDPAYGQLRGVS
ncbi:hypothetical protein [Mesorhizobium escarrei]|uniref:hypothetical protein n=1 Tax=Mesorhizobium escarrei TaxID=666018 RepID=UPI0020A7ED9C|nr:hypothetical protein [Mesorhizobium escarrei]